MKLFIVLFLAVILFDCGKKSQPRPTPTPRPTPVNTPSPEPTIEPIPTPTIVPIPDSSPTPIKFPTPLPTPEVDLSKFNFKRAATYTKVSAIDGLLSTSVNQAMKDPDIEGVEIVGGGSIVAPIFLRKPTKFDSSTYSCDINESDRTFPGFPVTDYGCMIIADNIFVEGTYKIPKEMEDFFKFGDGRNPNDKYLLALQALTPEQLAGNGTTILEPNFFLPPPGNQPAIEVFQVENDVCCSHTGKAKNISITGFRIKGRQTKYDGGVRAAVMFGNMENGYISDIYLEDTGSIGITIGGSGLETNNYANNVVVTRIISSGVAAANIAMINTENAYAFNNYCLRPGHHDPLFAGGVSCFDLETNSPADHSKNIWVFNNLADYENAHQDGAGTAYVLQDPYFGVNHGKVTAINNVAIGGRNNERRFMSNGFFLNGLTECHIANNYIYKTGQNAIQAYGIKKCLIEDNIFDSVGGGGSVAFYAEQIIDSIIRRNNYFSQPNVKFNIAAGFMEICSERNIYEENHVDGRLISFAKRCP